MRKEDDFLEYVIVGNGPASIGAVIGIRETDTKNNITIISEEPYPAYSKELIFNWFEGSLSENKIFIGSKSLSPQNNVKTIYNFTATEIDLTQKIVKLSNGSAVPYDKLLIATGYKSYLPDIPGINSVTLKYDFNSLNNAKDLSTKIKMTSRILIIGNEFHALRATEVLSRFAQSITIVDKADRIFSDTLDKESSQKIRRHCEENGIKFHLKACIEKFLNNKCFLSNGKTIDFDILINAVPPSPQCELIKKQDGKTNWGIITDLTQLTSLRNIYAAGNCTEYFDISSDKNKILTSSSAAYQQGLVAGKNMSGKISYFLNNIPVYSINIFGLQIIFAGTLKGQMLSSTDTDDYKKLFIKDDMLKGFILIGNVERAGIYTSIIKNRIPLQSLNLNLLQASPSVCAFNKIKRLEIFAGMSFDD